MFPKPVWSWQFAVPSGISIAGLAPVLLLLAEPYHSLVVGLALYQLLLDDLDGMAARALNTGTALGRALDDICDAVAHVLIVGTIGFAMGSWTALAAGITMLTIVVRTASRRSGNVDLRWGSATNEGVVVIILAWSALGNGADVPNAAIAGMLLLQAVGMLIPAPILTPRARLVRPLPILGYNLGLVLACTYAPLTLPALFLFSGWHAFSLISSFRSYSSSSSQEGSRGN